MLVPSPKTSAGNRVKTPEMNHHSQVLARLTVYIYAERFEPGQGSKPVKAIARLGKISKRYRPGEDNEERAYLGAIEQAILIACNEVYRLKERKERFSRVFISRLEDAQKARQDSGSFEYRCH